MSRLRQQYGPCFAYRRLLKVRGLLTVGTAGLVRRALAVRLGLGLLVMAVAAFAIGTGNSGRGDTETRILLVSSPAGSAVVNKSYALRLGSYVLFLIPRPNDRHMQPTKLVAEGFRGSRSLGDDGVVVGWTGEDHLTVGRPLGDEMPPKGPARAGDIEVTYINYEPNLSKTTPDRRDQVVLQDVKYVAGSRPDARSGDCVVEVQGTDGEFFSSVSVTLIRPSYALSYDGVKQFVLGSNSLEFSVTPLANSRSPQLTPTQAKLAGIAPRTDSRDARIDLRQTSTTLRYGGYGGLDESRVLQLMHEGSYPIRFNLTFGVRQFEYIVQEPISDDVVAAYQACVAQH